MCSGVGVLLIPIIPSLLGIYFGNKARAEILARGGPTGSPGEEMTRWGLILGWVGVLGGLLTALTLLVLWWLAPDTLATVADYADG